MQRRSQSGFSFTSFIFFLALAAAAVYAYSLVPLYLRNYQLKQAARAAANQHFSQGTPPGKMLDDYLAEAARLGEGLDDRNVSISLGPGDEWVAFAVSYNAPYQFPFIKEWRYEAFRWELRENRQRQRVGE